MTTVEEDVARVKAVTAALCGALDTVWLVDEEEGESLRSERTNAFATFTGAKTYLLQCVKDCGAPDLECNRLIGTLEDDWPNVDWCNDNGDYRVFLYKRDVTP